MTPLTTVGGGILSALGAVMGGCTEPVQFGDAREGDGGALVAYWKLDETSGAVAADSSPSGNDGTYEGGLLPSVVVAPLLFANPASLAFDQTVATDISVPNSPSLALSGPLTLAAWIHPTGQATTQQGIIEKWDPDSGSSGVGAARGFEFRVTQEQMVRVLLLAQPGRSVQLVGTTAVAADVWTHLAATCDGTVLRLFVNGVEDARIASAVTPVPGTSPLHIGRDYGDNGFQGNLDDVRIYGRALTPDEVKALARGEDVPG